MLEGGLEIRHRASQFGERVSMCVRLLYKTFVDSYSENESAMEEEERCK